MKFLFDFFPILLFFLAFKFGDIYLATLTAIIASGAQVLWLRYKKGRFEKLSLITLLIILVLGGATLIFRNELFIKWKPTALYWLLALGFLLSHFIGKSPLIQKFLQENIQLPDPVWRQLNLSWVFFFTLMGVLNLFIVYNFDTTVWVNFKLFGTLLLTFVFIMMQGIYMAKHLKPHVKSESSNESH